MSPREAARARGDKYYFSPDPCGNGHNAARLVSNRSCVECVSISRRARHAKHGSRAAYEAARLGVSASVVHAFKNMHNRCRLPSHPKYHDYGGRGITVCKRWSGAGGLRHFVEDMGEKPSRAHSLDRERVNEGYHPGNCRWATTKTQAANKRRVGNLNNFTFDELVRHLMAWPECERTRFVQAITGDEDEPSRSGIHSGTTRARAEADSSAQSSSTR